jgi:hypothetical protein
MNNYSSKEDLKSRMLRHISAIWDVKNTETLDPLVRILIESLAGELQKTHNEINNFESRILEKIAVMMTPGVLSAPYCAHAIAYAKPTEAIQIITPSTHFFYLKKATAAKEKNQELFFTPVNSVQLADGTLSYIVAGNTAFSMDANLQKTIFMNGKSGAARKNEIWLGIQLNKEIETIDKLRFYFDIKNTENKYQLQSLLQLSKWYVNEKEVQTVKGIVYEQEEEQERKQQSIFSEYDVMYLIEQEIKQLYNNQFITLSDPSHQVMVKDQLKTVPEEFKTMFAVPDLAKLTKELLWVKITTSAFIDERTIFDLFVSINAFPVVNRSLKNTAHRFKGITNIIPIKTDVFEHFLCVKSLKDLKGREYTQIPFAQTNNAETGTYSVRKGGIERFDTRSAKEYLNYLIELMRDESAIFSSYGQDAVTSLIKDLERVLAQIEQRIKQNEFYNADMHHYITLGMIENQNTVNVEYWITNGAIANTIHTGAHLSLYEGTEVKLNSIVLLSTTSGGKKNIELSRHMEAYRYALLTHNRLVTIEDIKAFCMYELGDKIAGVEIKKGVMRSTNPKEGLVRCIDIVLQQKKNAAENNTAEEWELLFKEVKSKLELRSAMNSNYRLMLM